MLNFKESLEKLLEDMVEPINEAILNREFKKVNEDEYTIEIEVLGEVVSIWNVDGQETHLSRIKLGLCESLPFPIGKLKKPKTCRKLIRENTKDEVEEINKKIDEEIKKLQEKKVK